MKINSIFKQLSLFNLILFAVLLAVVEYPFFSGWIEHFGNSDLIYLGVVVLVVWVILLALETTLIFKLDIKVPKLFFTPLLLTHLPWFFYFAKPFFMAMTLPDPHNTLFRKSQILFGLVCITHLFLFSGWLLWRTRNNKKLISITFAWVAVFFFVGTTLWTTQCDLSGDEPHYLLMTHSLIHDRDLDLTNNYLNKDYETFYHRGVLEPQGLEHVIDGKRYSHHPLGPSLVVLPGFWLAGRLGAALTMALLTALALFLTLRVLEMSGAKCLLLQAVGVIGLFSSPFLLFDGLIFPEVPTACLTALTLYLFLQKRWQWLGLALGAFLWMHNRNALLVMPFLVLIGYEILRQKDLPPRRQALSHRSEGPMAKGTLKGKHLNLFKLLAGFGIPTALLVLYFHAIYGVWTPLGAHNEPFSSLFSFGHFWTGFFGLLVDQECGLWFHFPVFAVAVTGGMILWRSKNPLHVLAAAVFIFYYLFMSFYENLGLTPATRYMVGVTPLLLILLYPALAVMNQFRTWEFLTIFSFLMGAAVNWVLAVVPWMRYNKLEGENMMLKIAGGFLHRSLTALEPAFQSPVIQTQSYVLSAFWVGLTVALSIWFIREKVKR